MCLCKRRVWQLNCATQHSCKAFSFGRTTFGPRQGSPSAPTSVLISFGG